MKYRITPFNIASGTAIGFAIFYGINPGPMQFGIMLSLFLIIAALLGLFIDFIIQKAAKNYLKIFLFECCLSLILFISYIWTQRTKTLLIPNQLETKYVVVVYGIDSAPELPKGFLTWRYKIKIPENGILLTSTKMSSDLPQTEMETYSGINLDTEGSHLSWGRFSTDKFECNGKIYHYQSWLIDKHCCMYSSDEQKALRNQLQKQLCDLKEAL
ncbi:MAG: hypothetical protein ACO1OQ_02435 [Rufibacter sp.]